MKLWITLLLSLIVATGFDCSPLAKRKLQNGTLLKKFDPRVIGEYNLGVIRRNGKVIANAYGTVEIEEYFKNKLRKTENKGRKPSTKSLEMTFVVGNTYNYVLELSKKGVWSVKYDETTEVGVDHKTERIENLIRYIMYSFKGFLIQGSKISLLNKTGLSLELRRVKKNRASRKRN